MVSVTGTIFKSVINDSVISDTNAEYMLDLAIDVLNLYGADLSNMTGAAGSKTVNLESKEKGAVFLVARAIYYGFYKGIEPGIVDTVTVGATDVLGNPTILASIKEAARQLTEIEVDVG